MTNHYSAQIRAGLSRIKSAVEQKRLPPFSISTSFSASRSRRCSREPAGDDRGARYRGSACRGQRGGSDRGGCGGSGPGLAMIPGPSPRIVLATRPVDFRRGHDALAATASIELGLDIHSGVIVIFRSKRGDRLKLIYWDSLRAAGRRASLPTSSPSSSFALPPRRRKMTPWHRHGEAGTAVRKITHPSSGCGSICRASTAAGRVQHGVRGRPPEAGFCREPRHR